jgi:hypothetical protein
MECQFCGRIGKSKNSNIQHELRCKLNPARIVVASSYGGTSTYEDGESKLCEFCGSEYKNKSGYSNHIRRCPDNPDRVIETLTDEGRKSISDFNAGKSWSVEKKQKHSEVMLKTVKNNPESYTSSNRGRVKQIIVDGIKLHGQWEVDFYKWAVSNGFEIERPLNGFEYIWKGNRIYYPDFYLKSLNLYVEVKGYETDRDRAKWSQFPHKLVIIRQKEIELIRCGNFYLGQ